MTYQIPNIFGNDDGNVPASQLDQNFQYLLGLIEAGNTVISILHSQVSDWTPAVQLTIQQYLTSTDGTVNISSSNGLLNLRAIPSNASVQSIIQSYLISSDGSVTLTATGGQLNIKATQQTLTHSNISDWTSSVQSTVAAYLESTDGSITISNNAGLLNLKANLGSSFSHTSISDWTSAVQTTIAGYLESSDGTILIAPSGGLLNLRAATPTITHSNVSDFTSTTQTIIGNYLAAGNSSISLSISNGQLLISGVQQSITHTSVSDWTTALQNSVASYITNTDGSITITNSGGQLNFRATSPTISHSSVSDWTTALNSGILSYLTSDGTVTFSQVSGQLSLHAVTPSLTSSNISNFSSAVQTVVGSYLESTDGSITFTPTGGLLNVKAPTPTVTHSNVSDWTTALQNSVAAYLECTDGSITLTNSGGLLNIKAPTPTVTHSNVSDWTTALQSSINSYLQGDTTISITQGSGVLNFHVNSPTITHSGVSDWTTAVQNSVAAYLESTDGSITLTNTGGLLNLKAVSQTIPHTQVSDWSSAVQSAIQGYLHNTDGTINISASGGFLNFSAVTPNITHSQVTDWTTAVDNAVSNYLTNTDGSITLTNTGSNLNIKSNIVVPSSFSHTAITDWTTAVQAIIATYLESSDSSISITQSGGFLNLRTSVPVLTHSTITDWTSAVEATVAGFLVNTDGTISITNSGNSLVLSATPVTVQIPHTSVTDWTPSVQAVINSYLTSSNGSITITNSGGLLNIQAVQQTLPHTNISDWTNAVEATIAGYLTSTNGTISITNTGTSLNLAATIPTNITTTNISNFTSGVESVIATYLESTDGSINISIDNTNNKLNLISTVSGSGPGTISHVSISDWTSAVEATVASYVVAQNSTITVTNNGSSLGVAVTPFTHTAVTDWTTAVFNTLAASVESTGGTISIANTGTQLNLAMVGQSHSWITDWNAAVLASVSSILTSQNGSVTFTPVGNQLSLAAAGGSGSFPSSEPHTYISDWTPAVQSVILGYLTGSSTVTLTNTGTSLQFGVTPFNHTAVTDWTSAVFGTLAASVESVTGTISIANTGTQLNFGMVAQNHSWITDWNTAVLSSIESILTSSNNSISITPSGSQLNIQVSSGGGATITTSPSPLTVVSGTGSNVQIAALSTTGFTGPYTYSIVNPSGRFAITGSNLVTGNTPTNYSALPNDSVTIQSTNGTNTVSVTFPVTITQQTGPTAPIFDMNFVTGSYTGATPATGLSCSQPNTTTAPDHTGAVHTFAPNTPRITDLGLFITPGSIVFAGHFDTTPNSWGYTPYTVGPVNNYNTLVSKTVLSQNGIFTPLTCVFSDNTGSRLVPGVTTANCPQGTNVTVTARVQPSSTGNEGLRIAFECLTGSGGASSQASPVIWHNLLTSVQPFYNPSNLVVTVTQPLTGVFDVVIYGPVPGDGTTPNNFTVSIAPGTGGDGSSTSNPFTSTSGGQNATITFWGMSTAVGHYGANFGQTGASTVTTQGDLIQLAAGVTDVAIAGAAGTIVIELGPLTSTPSGFSNGSIITANAGGTDILSAFSWTSMSSNNAAQIVPVGMGGFAGITRVAFAHDNTGYSMCINGGLVGQFATLLTLTGVQQLLRSMAGTVRRLTGWNYRLTNTNLQIQSQISNQSFVNTGSGSTPVVGQSLNVNNTAQTFFDDFLNINTIRTWAAGTNSSTFNPTTGPLETTTSQTASGGVYGATGNWLPRFPYDARYGSGSVGSNPGSEYQWYVDPNYPWPSGFISPFTQSGSALTITLRHVSDMGSNVVTQFANSSVVPVRPSSVSGSAVPYDWASGILTSEGVFSQAEGYFEIRAKVPTQHSTWPAWWIYATFSAGPRLEIDIMEAFGTFASDQAHLNTSYNSALHAPGNSANVFDITCQTPADKNANFYTYGVLWRSGSLQFYQNGAMQYYINYTNGSCIPAANGGFIQSGGTFPVTNLDTQPMYMIINLANGNNGTSVPDGTEEGAQYVIDYVGVWS